MVKSTTVRRYKYDGTEKSTSTKVAVMCCKKGEKYELWCRAKSTTVLCTCTSDGTLLVAKSTTVL